MWGHNFNGESYCSQFTQPVIAALRVTRRRIGYIWYDVVNVTNRVTMPKVLYFVMIDLIAFKRQ